MVDVAWQDAIKEHFSSKPTKEEREKHFGNALVQKWKTEFESRCWDSDQFAESSLHVLFGQLNSIRKIRIKYDKNISDNRIHLMLFQRSGTGKGRGFNFTVQMADQLNMECVSPDDVSDAKLVGRFKTPMGQQEPVLVRGYLDPRRLPRVSILIQNEATLILDVKASSFSNKFMNFYQKSMNPIGTPDNLIEAGTIEMGEQEVRVNPELSLYLTTYPPDKLVQTITKAGFIQRMITLYNVIGYDRRVRSWEIMAQKTSNLSSIKEGENYIPEIIAALKHIEKHYAANPTIIMSTEARKISGNIMKEVYNPLTKVNDAMREHLSDFVPRVYENIIKMSYHHGMMRLSPVVENIDVGYALNVMLPAWTRLITYMEESEEIVRATLSRWERFRKDSFDIHDIITKEQKTRNKYNDGWVKRETMVKYLTSKMYGWDVSKPTVRSRLNKLTIDLKYYKEKKDGGVKHIKKRFI